MSESEIKKAITDALRKCGCYVVRVNSGGYRGRSMGAKKGTPDLFVWPAPGRAFVLRDGLRNSLRIHEHDSAAIETKASHKDACVCSSCAAQRVERAELEARGVLYVLARTVDEALRGLGLI